MVCVRNSLRYGAIYCKNYEVMSAERGRSKESIRGFAKINKRANYTKINYATNLATLPKGVSYMECFLTTPHYVQPNEIIN